MSPTQHEIHELSVRLFGEDGTGGAVGRIDERLALIEQRVNRWDGAFTFIRVASSFVGLGGLGLFITAVVSAAGK